MDFRYPRAEQWSGGIPNRKRAGEWVAIDELLDDDDPSDGKYTPNTTRLDHSSLTTSYVTDEGVDNAGSSNVNSDVDSLFAEDTLLYFPPETYKVDGGSSMGGSYDNVGMEGDDAAFLREEPGETDPAIDITADAVYVGGFEFDQTANDTGVVVVSTGASDTGLVEDWETFGYNQNHDDIFNSMRFVATPRWPSCLSIRSNS